METTELDSDTEHSSIHNAPPTSNEGVSERKVEAMHPTHLADLRKSGLTDATIERLGIYTETDPEKVDRLLQRSAGFAAKNQLGPCLVFPYPKAKHVRLKPLYPRSVGEVPVVRNLHGEQEEGEDDRKSIKYESPIKGGQFVYDAREVYQGTSNYQRVWCTEGEKKAALMNQAGLPTFGLSGVDCAHDPNGKAQADDEGDPDPYRLLGPIQECATKGMEICVVFDYPDMDGTNPQVIRAAVRTLKMVQRAGGVPMLSYVSGQDVSKVGVDDYYMALTGSERNETFVEDMERDARPAPPNACLKWLESIVNEDCWDKAVTRVEVKRAALIAGAWLDTPKALRDWIRKAVKVLPSRFKIGEQDLEAWAKVTCPKACRREDPRAFIAVWAPRHHVSYDYGTQMIRADGKDTDTGLLFSMMALDTAIPDSELRHAFELWLDDQDKTALDRIRMRLAYAGCDGEIWRRWIRAVTGKEDPVDIAVMKHWIWQVRRKLFGLPVEHHLMPIFTGHPGSGKSTAITKFLKPIEELRALRDADILQDERQSSVLARSYVIFFDEMPKVAATDRDCIKNRITSETVSWRKLGTNTHVTRRNVASFIGAANEDVASLLYDPTGMRRFYEFQALPLLDWNAVNGIDYWAMWKGVDHTEASPLLAHLAEIKKRQEGLRSLDSVEEFLTYSCRREGWTNAKGVYNGYVAACNSRRQKALGEQKFYRTLRKHMPDDGRDWKKTGGNTHYNLSVIEQCENASSFNGGPKGREQGWGQPSASPSDSGKSSADSSVREGREDGDAKFN